ncbi:protein meaA [Nocardioides marmoribigeumensis]|uniref:(2R)-ethylmalonyl-CoA mutase n=1 Tax=Nocardioides marmoribigeumensis TaxID=433649 RepID=A0ABU2BYY7_9ACTN|nr:protein meaA [Nocardioides marmoribigeumensis]MDR7363625.1 (2R)-ethylmalonyl-CoA mutase [Nocardioides marmoribigeumensis]
MSEQPETPTPPTATRPERDRPWVMRTYAGHSSAAESNALYRRNLSKGQTGLSVAFDLPTQTGYDPDSTLARGEVGKVGVPIPHLGDMRKLFDQIPLTEMNTSMTINATAMWLLALYQVVAEEQAGATTDEEIEAVHNKLAGTTQNDIIKEYLSRGTYVFPPEHSLRLTTDTIAYTVNHIPKWNPINICSYHLQEAGATPVQELAYALCTAIAVLDAVRDSGQVAPEEMGKVVGRISFFVNAGVRFVEETCKMRAFVELWDEITRERYGVTDDKMRRFRYGVQVNSLGLTEAQPENNVQRIVLEMLGVTLSKNARARAVQLPAWNEALGLPRPWDQQWSLRLQQVLAFESDLLEYDDIFEGSHVIETKVAELVTGARAEIDRVQAMGGAIAAVESGYMKQALVSSHAARRARIEAGHEVVVGVNKFETTEESPLTADLDAAIQVADPEAERAAQASVEQWKSQRDQAEVDAALQRLVEDAKSGANLMEATLAAARAGATTGEWAGTLREVFGEYRAPTGVSGAVGVAEAGAELTAVRDAVKATGDELGGRLRLLVGKPGLDGHSNGAEQVAVRARDAGFEVIYQGIRLTPEQIVSAAVAEDVHCVGLSILSGSHMELVPAVLDGLRAEGMDDVPVIVGGIIPSSDAARLKELGVAEVFTPKDFGLTEIMAGIVRVIRRANGLD